MTFPRFSFSMLLLLARTFKLTVLSYLQLFSVYSIWILPPLVFQKSKQGSTFLFHSMCAHIHTNIHTHAQTQHTPCADTYIPGIHAQTQDTHMHTYARTHTCVRAHTHRWTGMTKSKLRQMSPVGRLLTGPGSTE